MNAVHNVISPIYIVTFIAVYFIGSPLISLNGEDIISPLYVIRMVYNRDNYHPYIRLRYVMVVVLVVSQVHRLR